MLTGVINSSPIIAFSMLNLIEIFEKVFEKAYIPHEVINEIMYAGSNSNYGKNELRTLLNSERVFAYQVINSMFVLKHYGKLHAGELEVIVAGIELNADLVVLDDLSARRLAGDFGLKPIGTVGILKIAKKIGYVAKIEPLLFQLRRRGFRISDKMIEQILTEEGE